MSTDKEMDWGGIRPTVEGVKVGSTRPGMSPVGYLQGAPAAVQQAINANGAISLTTYYTALTSVATTGVTFTLADGTYVGQVKKIQMIVDDGDATVTFNGNATVVFADVGDVAVLKWNGSDWIPIELSNNADGATAPVYTPAS